MPANYIRVCDWSIGITWSKFVKPRMRYLTLMKRWVLSFLVKNNSSNVVCLHDKAKMAAHPLFSKCEWCMSLLKELALKSSLFQEWQAPFSLGKQRLAAFCLKHLTACFRNLINQKTSKIKHFLLNWTFQLLDFLLKP